MHELNLKSEKSAENTEQNKSKIKDTIKDIILLGRAFSILLCILIATRRSFEKALDHRRI